ncbi:protein MFI [Pseudochaenichthys georgianus]|uniref:protein MFI n=1 Tax=Pseudochaenichthys georgianus TaxID=52239 RepID=UPI00146DB8B5|nr:protein MFI [Pseudochaenichthys georgianus]
MSSQDKGPQEPRQETLQQVAATVIQKAWRRHVCIEVFKYVKCLINECNQRDPKKILKSVNPREAELLDAAAGVFIRFRLGGITFPPNIYYKIYTHRPITDMCASSPKDYTQPDLKKPAAQQNKQRQPLKQEDRSGWYRRLENNSWRLFCSKVASMSEPEEIGANKEMDFHHSRLQRQQDVDMWRKKRKIEWLKHMYNQGRLQTHPVHRHMAILVENSAQEVMSTIKEKGNAEILEWELDELLAWTNTLNFEDYMQDWKGLACSDSSEPSKDSYSYPPRLDQHELAAVAAEDG